MQRAHGSPHRRALRAARGSFVKVLDLVVFQALIRLLALSPVLYAAVTGEFPVPSAFRGHELAFAILCSLPLYALIVLPFRFQAAAEMAVMHGWGRETRVSAGRWGKWFLAAMLRLLYALPFLLPLMAFLGAYYYYMRVPGFNETLLAIEQAGKWVGGSYAAGVALITAVGIVAAALAAWGWKRGKAFEHREIQGRTLYHALREARQVRRQRRRRFAQTVRRNFLLALPAILGVALVLALHFRATWSGMPEFDFINIGVTLITFSVPSAVAMRIAAVLLVLWLPLLPMRKLALSAVLAPPPKDAGEEPHAD